MHIYVVIPTVLSLMLIFGSRDERYSFCSHGAGSLDVELSVQKFTHSALAVLVSFMFQGTVRMVFPQGLCTSSSV